jgi:hypothetical protein
VRSMVVHFTSQAWPQSRKVAIASTSGEILPGRTKSTGRLGEILHTGSVSLSLSEWLKYGGRRDGRFGRGLVRHSVCEKC